MIFTFFRTGAAGILLAALVVPGLAAQAGPKDSLPPGVTEATVARGRDLYLGPGICLACHGADGKGPIGPDLTDSLWIHSDGSVAGILETLKSGVSDQASRSGTPMPARGGSGLTDDELAAVAAYVWSLSRWKTSS